MPIVEIKDFNALIDNKQFSDKPVETKKKSMKNLSKRQEMMDIQQEPYLFIFTIKNKNLLPLIYQDKQVQPFLNNLVLQ